MKIKWLLYLLIYMFYTVSLIAGIGQSTMGQYITGSEEQTNHSLGKLQKLEADPLITILSFLPTKSLDSVMRTSKKMNEHGEKAFKQRWKLDKWNFNHDLSLLLKKLPKIEENDYICFKKFICMALDAFQSGGYPEQTQDLAGFITLCPVIEAKVYNALNEPKLKLFFGKLVPYSYTIDFISSPYNNNIFEEPIKNLANIKCSEHESEELNLLIENFQKSGSLLQKFLTGKTLDPNKKILMNFVQCAKDRAEFKRPIHLKIFNINDEIDFSPLLDVQFITKLRLVLSKGSHLETCAKLIQTCQQLEFLELESGGYNELSTVEPLLNCLSNLKIKSLKLIDYSSAPDICKELIKSSLLVSTLEELSIDMKNWSKPQYSWNREPYDFSKVIKLRKISINSPNGFEHVSDFFHSLQGNLTLREVDCSGDGMVERELDVLKLLPNLEKITFFTRKFESVTELLKQAPNLKEVIAKAIFCKNKSGEFKNLGEVLEKHPSLESFVLGVGPYEEYKAPLENEVRKIFNENYQYIQSVVNKNKNLRRLVIFYHERINNPERRNKDHWHARDLLNSKDMQNRNPSIAVSMTQREVG